MLANFLANKVRKYSSKGKPLGKFQYRAYIYKHLFVKACFTKYIWQCIVAVALDTSKPNIIYTEKPYKGA